MSNNSEKLDINFIIVRHALTCGNLLQKGLNYRTAVVQPKINELTPDTDICNLGIAQCFQLSDFLKAQKEKGFDYIGSNTNGINKNNNNKQEIETIFCCSELKRTQETLYIAFREYLPEYLNKKKILVFPWLKEIDMIKMTTPSKENIPEPLPVRKINWKRFLRNFNFYRENYFKDLGRTDKIPEVKIDGEEEWENLFKEVLGSSEFDLEKIATSLINELKEYKGKRINLVVVTHSNNGSRLIRALIPESELSLTSTGGLINCEMVKLPKITLNKNYFEITKNSCKSFAKCRIFPIGFYNQILKDGTREDLDTYTNPRYFLFYAYQFNIFFTLFNIIPNKAFDDIEITPNENTLIKFLELPFQNYLSLARTYIKTLDNLKKFYEKISINYNYEELYKIIKKTFDEFDKLKAGMQKWIKKNNIIGQNRLPSSYFNTQASSEEEKTYKTLLENIYKTKNSTFIKKIRTGANTKQTDLRIADVFDKKELHKYFFYGCKQSLQYLCEKCDGSNDFKKTEKSFFGKATIVDQDPFYYKFDIYPSVKNKLISKVTRKL